MKKPRLVRTLVQFERNSFEYTYTLLTCIGVLQRANVTVLLMGSDGEQGTDTGICCLGMVVPTF